MLSLGVFHSSFSSAAYLNKMCLSCSFSSLDLVFFFPAKIDKAGHALQKSLHSSFKTSSLVGSSPGQLSSGQPVTALVILALVDAISVLSSPTSGCLRYMR